MTDEKQGEQKEEPTPSGSGEPAASTEPQQPVVPPAPVVKKLVRRPEGKLIAGVCTGLGAYTGVDPVVWRIGFVLTALFGGIGIIAYPIAWLVLPMAAEGDPLPPPPSDQVRVGRWIGIGAIIIGALILFNGVFNLRGGIFWGLLLVGAGVAIWGRELLPESMRPPPRTPPPVPPQGPGWGITETTPMSAMPPNAPVTPRPPMPPPPARPWPPTTPAAPTPSPKRRESSVLGRLVVGAAALAVGIGFLLDNLGVIQLTAVGMLAVLVAIIGIGLLVGTFWGRARWLIFPGAVLVLFLLVVSLLPGFTHASFGQVLWQPTARSDIRQVYEHGAGQAVLDLSKVKLGDRRRDVEIKLGAGQLLIVVPRNVRVQVSAQVVGGQLNLFGREQQGFQAEDGVTRSGRDELGTYRIDAHMGFGQIYARRAMPGDDFTNIGDAFDEFDRRFRSFGGRFDRRDAR